MSTAGSPTCGTVARARSPTPVGEGPVLSPWRTGDRTAPTNSHSCRTDSASRGRSTPRPRERRRGPSPPACRPDPGRVDRRAGHPRTTPVRRLQREDAQHLHRLFQPMTCSPSSPPRTPSGEAGPTNPTTAWWRPGGAPLRSAPPRPRARCCRSASVAERTDDLLDHTAQVVAATQAEDGDQRGDLPICNWTVHQAADHGRAEGSRAIAPRCASSRSRIVTPDTGHSLETTELGYQRSHLPPPVGG